MKQPLNYIIILITTLFLISSCKKEEQFEGDYNPEVVESYKNEKNIPKDSIEAINQITSQKIQELYDLGILSVYNDADNELDTILITQMNTYFSEKDTAQIQSLLREIKTKEAHYVKIIKVQRQNTDSTANDTLGISKFSIKYYNKEKKLIDLQDKYIKYILKKNPEKFKSEFKFYFVKLAENDSILKGEIR